MKHLDLTKNWYKRSVLNYGLAPLSGLYRSVVALRRGLYRTHLKKTTRFATPIIVVGNITVGGTGKTPLVAWMVEWLRAQGFRPGLVSRGYGGQAKTWPQHVSVDSDPSLVGDEPVMLVQQVHVPMVVGPDRVAAVRELLERYDCNIVVSDDGLQHYAMARDLEIAVIDGQRGLGNRFCLPVGPLREPVGRLRSVDWVVVNGGEQDEYSMQLDPGQFYLLSKPKQAVSVAALQNKKLHAYAAIGNPQRFFDELKKMGLSFVAHTFPDHYQYQINDFDVDEDACIIMTQKDAVKCQTFVDDRFYCLPVFAKPCDAFVQSFEQRLADLKT